MENFDYIMIILSLICSVIFIITTLSIYDFLKKRGEKVSFLLLRFLIISYVRDYKRITNLEYNKTGKLYWIWIISINAALLSFIIFSINYFL